MEQLLGMQQQLGHQNKLTQCQSMLVLVIQYWYVASMAFATLAKNTLSNAHAM